MGRDVLVLVPELPSANCEPDGGQHDARAHTGGRLPYLAPKEHKTEEPGREEEERNAGHDGPLRARPGLRAEEDIHTQEDREEQGHRHWLLARRPYAVRLARPPDRVEPPRSAE